MPTNQAPRVAVTDPLADFRSRKLSKPEGLGAKSDFPPREVNRMPISSQFGARPTMTRRDSDMSSDGGQDYDDFDWSDEDDIEEAARFEEERAKQIRMGRLSLWKISKFLATTFLGNLIISCALIVPVIVIQFVYRTQNTTSERDADHKDFVADNIQAWFIWAAFNLHVEWWLHILVELFPRAFLFLLRGVWGRPSQSILSLAEYYNAIKGYIKPIFYAALSWGSWAIIFDAIYGLYDHSNSRGSRAAYLYRIYQVIEFFFFFTLTICVEKILIKYIAMSFHKSAYAERVANVTRSLEVFDHLRDHKPKQKQREGEHSHKGSTFGFGRSGQFKNSPTVSGAATPIAPIDFVSDNELNNSGASTPSKGKWFGKHSQKRPSPRHTSDTLPQGDMPVALDVTGAGQAPARGSGKSALIARAAKSGRAMRTTASQASTLARVAMNDPFGLLNNETIGVGADINSPSAAKKLARSIFVAFRGSHKRAYLIPSDFEVAYASPEEAKEAFSVFDRDNNGDISQSEIKNTVMQVYKERRFLSRSMQDVNHAVGQLDSIFLIVALVIIMFEALAIFNVDISKTLTTFYTLAIAFAFIFKESAANVFDSIIFLFVTHPFDTGDRISIAGKVFVVKKMSLLSSLFVNDLNQDVYIANSILAATSIVNMRRSGYMWECITAQFAFDTPLEKLDAVEADMIHWLQTEPERLFVPSTAIVPQSIDYMRSMECTIGMTHSDNWQDWGRRFYRKNAFFAAFSFYCKKHGIRYANSNQPIVYWQDDAAALPPSYDGDDKDLDTNAVLASGGYVNDDFSPSPPSSPRSVPSGSTVIPPAPKPKTYMNFTPPPDELDGSGLRMRKLKKSDKEVTVQGGDG
ncbi:hypothetical protein IE53DRAFT_313183 [Violaceomyces palustris]|uniref:Uncharacterized protein n=1 Tax=Violaceomyces palustris TaxID=1673888 RepID=A0ACD0P137_9BASI|nr:hypothetical protein IE53DRAFT_313183 [Violaceomyces palustris]